MEVSTELVSPNSILRKLHLHTCLNVCKLAALHGVDVGRLEQRIVVRLVGGGPFTGGL